MDSNRQYCFNDFMKSGIYWITPCIAQGAYPELKTLRQLRESGVTHIFNVGGSPLIAEAQTMGFTELFWKPIIDLQLVPAAEVQDCISAIHRMLIQPNSAIYIHCVAGQNRSPSILWLFLIACGVPPLQAKSMIESNTLDAIAGHGALVNESHVELAQKFGEKHIFPLNRKEIISPIVLTK